MANLLASAARLGTCAGVYPLIQANPVTAVQPDTCCQPSIRPWSMAACCAATSCPILGTLSGVTPGVTTAPFESLTNDGMPPAGHRPGWFLHQYPRRLSNEWFSR